MTNKILTIADVLELYKNNDIETIKYKCFYDWFCKDTSLKNKTIFLTKRLISLLPSDKIDINKMAVFFKNNCSCYYGLYDDIRIVDIESGKTIYTIVPVSKSHDYKPALWDDSKNNMEEPLLYENWRELKSYFKNTNK